MIRFSAARKWLSSPKKTAYLLAGTDLVAIAELKRDLIAKFGGDDPLMLSRSDFDAAHDAPSAIFDALRELPLFLDRRVIVIRNAHKLLDEKKFPKIADDVKEVSDSTLLILIMEGKEKELKGKPLVDFCESAGTAGYFYAPGDDEEAVGWVAEYAVRRGFSVDRAAASAFVAMVGADVLELASEIEKVAFATDGKINAAAVKEFLMLHREDPVFDWADSVLLGDEKAALLVSSVTENGKAAVPALAVLVSRLQMIEDSEVKEPTYLPPKAREKLGAIRSRWPEKRRAPARKILLDLDLDLKSHSADQYVTLTELAVIRIAALAR